MAREIAQKDIPAEAWLSAFRGELRSTRKVLRRVKITGTQASIAYMEGMEYGLKELLRHAKRAAETMRDGDDAP